MHLRADVSVFGATSFAVPAAMSRFKVSKFRHMEARLPRREVSLVRGLRIPSFSPDPAGDPGAHMNPGVPFRPGSGNRAAPSPPGGHSPELLGRFPAA